ncbi:hypothetical protein C6P45_002387 [Maudiozyma exigua]|uniref:Uncharacterized protein n=1 Tax=Maudiozyma exigua TaxID=34358 RepID=A0A9P6WCZ5_MAUEX|nr:hypothetical protein C6P45_002387 [Kazachstania exigua]
MGVCGSKTETVQPSKVTEKPPITERITKEVKSSKSSKDYPASKKKTTTTSRPHDKGSKLSEKPNAESQNISPAEAARQAAEKRQKVQNDNLNQGVLGKKLAKERAKTYSSYRRDE